MTSLLAPVWTNKITFRGGEVGRDSIEHLHISV